MPKLRWTDVNPVPTDTEVTVMASRLPLRHYRSIPGFLQTTLRIRRQLAQAEGLVGYALDAELARKTFWTVSAWTDRDHLRGFDGADPHHAATEALRPRMEPTTFVFWTAVSNDLPIEWAEVRARLAERDEQQQDEEQQ